MKVRLPSKPVTGSIVTVLIAMLLFIPIQINLMSQDAGSACMDAELQAKSDVNTTTWWIIGCLAGLIGYLIALSPDNPPATNLLGKSEEYVAVYTDCYRKKTKDLKSKSALTGCLVGTAVTVGLYAILLATLPTTTDE